MAKNSIVFHHTAISGEKQYKKVYDYHNAGAGGKWRKGRGISYHHFIEKNGTAYSEKENTLKYHAGEMNAESIAICLAGDFSAEKPTQSQLRTALMLTVNAQVTWGFDDSRLFNHYEVRNTGCPVVNLRKLILNANKPKYSKSARIKQLGRGIARSTGYVKNMLLRQMARLLNRA